MISIAMKKADNIESRHAKADLGERVPGLLPPLPFSAPQFSECFNKLRMDEEFLVLFLPRVYTDKGGSEESIKKLTEWA